MGKFCANCDNELTEDSVFCSKCGSNRGETKPIQNNDSVQNVNVGESKTCGQAIASLVLSLVGLLIFGLICGILAISMSTVALNRIKIDSNLKGKGLAIAGLVIGIIDCVFVGLYTIINIITAL